MRKRAINILVASGTLIFFMVPLFLWLLENSHLNQTVMNVILIASAIYIATAIKVVLDHYPVIQVLKHANNMSVLAVWKMIAISAFFWPHNFVKNHRRFITSHFKIPPKILFSKPILRRDLSNSSDAKFYICRTAINEHPEFMKSQRFSKYKTLPERVAIIICYLPSKKVYLSGFMLLKPTTDLSREKLLKMTACSHGKIAAKQSLNECLQQIKRAGVNLPDDFVAGVKSSVDTLSSNVSYFDSTEYLANKE